MAEQTSLGFGTSGVGIQNFYIELDLAMTTVAGADISAYTAFDRAFSAAPKILGSNTVTSGAGAWAVADTDGITIHSYQASTDAPDATVAVSAFISGKLAD